MKYRIVAIFMTVFAAAQFGQTEKAHAATKEMATQKRSPFETTIHGGGCGCACCMQPAETITQNYHA